ncbi:MAG TPA: cytochrome b [Usitatibacter sp.]|nr:cytochrome b [Usitatibacter sp.]
MSNDSRYGAVAQTFHWVMAILVLIAFIYGPGGSELRVYSAARDFKRQLHETLGAIIFTLLLLRVIWRIVDTRPDPPDTPQWVGVISRAVQGLLYLFLFALPATAVTGAWLEGHPLTFLGGIEVAPLLDKSHDVGVVISKLHTWLGDTIMWLAGFHALAALFHHFVMRDGVLVSMLPRWLLPPGYRSR